MTPPSTIINWYEDLRAGFYVLFATVGGMLGYTLRQLHSNGRIRMVYVILEGLSAGFVGFIVFQICQELEMLTRWTGIVVGVFGWVGSSATIRVIETIVLKKIGINDDRAKELIDNPPVELPVPPRGQRPAPVPEPAPPAATPADSTDSDNGSN